MKPTELRFFGAFDQKRFRDEIELEYEASTFVVPIVFTQTYPFSNLLTTAVSRPR